MTLVFGYYEYNINANLSKLIYVSQHIFNIIYSLITVHKCYIHYKYKHKHLAGYLGTRMRVLVNTIRTIVTNNFNYFFGQVYFSKI
jgi:hypothetical protein